MSNFSSILALPSRVSQFPRQVYFKPYQPVLRYTLLCPDICVHNIISFYLIFLKAYPIYFQEITTHISLFLINIFTPTDWNYIFFTHIIQHSPYFPFFKVCFVFTPRIKVRDQQIICYPLSLNYSVIPYRIKG